MERRVVSLWLPNFATDRLHRIRRGSQSDFAPDPNAGLVTATAQHGGVRVVAVDGAARAAGIAPGLPLADARALSPGIRAVAADPAADAHALDSVAEWCGRYTPWTAVDAARAAPGDGGAWLDISGCAHLFGGEDALLADLTGRLRAMGFSTRAAIADTPGTAWAVARFGGDGAAVVPPGRLREALTPLPVSGLRLPPETVAALGRVGLRRIGELFDLPRAPLAARFRDSALRRIDQALGRLDEPLSPRRPPPPLRARLAFAEPIGRMEDIAETLRILLGDLCARMTAERLGARRLELTFHRTDGTCARAAVGTVRPSRDPEHLERLFRDRLDEIDAGFGIEAAVLAVPAADDLQPLQADLDADTRREDLTRLVDRLGNRLGPERVTRLEPAASHLPERACRAVPALAPRRDVPGLDGAHRPTRPRPIHLLPTPEPIEATAPVPDHPPVIFRRRRRIHRVARAEGPERVGPEWWGPEWRRPENRETRDYYRIEDTEGRRFWVYREGLYRPDRPPRWYLHGIFP